MKNFKSTLIQITNAGMGTGDEALGLQLISNYLKLITDETEIPGFFVFYNSGVKLICEDSPVIEQIKMLESKGAKLIACKTCLNHYNLLNKTEAGITGTMMDIVELQKMADKVITM